MPADAIKDLGLDGARQWLRMDELNRFVWPGLDLRPIPGKGAIDYGFLPEGIYNRLKAGILERQKRRAASIIPRD